MYYTKCQIPFYLWQIKFPWKHNKSFSLIVDTNCGSVDKAKN